MTSVDNHLVRFDVDGDGFREATGWVQSDDGLLVLDRNGDGYINDISELFGNQTTSGFVQLRGIDDNADGFIDTADTNFSRLQVWQDLDFDGRSDGNELFTLDELGISRIRTAASSTNVTNAGNQIAETSSFELADGTQREIVNVGFTVDQLNSYYDPNSTFSAPVVFTAEILSLPSLRGYGNLPDLQIAMATDEQLLALVRSLTEETSGDVSSAGERIREILFRWAGVDGIAPTSRGSSVNAQELGFIEKFVGRSYPPNLTITAAAGQTLSQTFADLEGTLAARLLVQVTEVPVEYDASSDQLVFNGDTNAALLHLEQASAQSVSSPSAQLDLEISVLKQFISEREEWILGSGSSEQLVGSTGEDRLYGFGGNDTLNANGSNALLDGGAGDDTLISGTGNDTLIGGAGNDLLNGSEGNDTYQFTRGDGQDIIHDLYQPYYIEPGGTDTLVFGEGITRADLSWSFDGTNLSFTVAGTGDQVTIRNINDTRQQLEQFVIAGETISLNEVMTSWVGTGTAGADNLTWNQSAVILDGLAGNDTITTGNYADTLYGGDGNDTINSNAGDDTLDGGAGDDTLDGGAGDDSVNGGDGNDQIWVWQGNDTVDGGAGSDRLFLNLGNQTTELVVDNPTSGITQAGIITFRNIEQFTIIGGSGNDRLVQAGLVVATHNTKRFRPQSALF